MTLLQRPLFLSLLVCGTLLARQTNASAAAVDPSPARGVIATAQPHVALAPQREAPQARGAVLPAQILGNRSRMIQMAFIAFAIGIAILVTSTRKY